MTIYFVQNRRPGNVIERTLGIKLPSDSKIIEYSYYNDGGNFDTKILIEDNSINSIKEQLNNFFKGPYKGEISDAPNFENTCQWWDLDKSNVDTYYFTVTGRKNKLFVSYPKTYIIWAFITKERNGQYYLYISY